MLELTREENLIDRVLNDNSLTKEDYEETRIYFIDKLLSYNDSSVFDFLVGWNINYKNFVSYRFQNMDRPDFTKNLIDILGAIAELDYKHKS